MSKGKYLFTSESVSMGHPDKLADQISDGVLDAYLAQDPLSRVACETLVTTGLAVVAGEITSKGTIDYQKVVRDVIRAVGYTDDEMGISADTCSVLVAVGKQSGDIAMGVNADDSTGKDIGAGDQGLMFGYACNETPELMPLPIALSHRILNRLTEARQKGEVDWLRPDSKSQVTIEYEGNTPKRLDTIVVSTQHAPHVSNEEIRPAGWGGPWGALARGTGGSSPTPSAWWGSVWGRSRRTPGRGIRSASTRSTRPSATSPRIASATSTNARRRWRW